jgi:hypothetical protein
MLWTLACVLQTACESGPVSGSGTSLQTISSRNAKATTTGVKAVALCPTAGTPMLLRSTPGVGDHEVVLSWNASLPSLRPENGAIGYCLYRSKKKRAAKKNATCRDCEQVNRVPITGLRCVDDVVKDGTTYYYVVAAINAAGKLSLPSNEIVAAIPANRRRLHSSSEGSLCRGTE